MATAKATDVDSENQAGRPLTGATVFAMLVAFFGTIAAVNGVMIYFALSTFRGEVEAHPYEHGLAYNRDIAAAQAQDKLHWRVAAHVGSTNPGGSKTVEAVFHDGNGRALAGLVVAAWLEFATDEKRDRAIALTEVAPGIYRGNLAIASGQWDFVIEAKRNAERAFLSRNRITIP